MTYSSDQNYWNVSDPYDSYQTIDDTPNPLSHGLFLSNLAGEASFQTIWNLGQGDHNALEQIGDTVTRAKAERLFSHLDSLGYWDDQLFGDEPTWK